MLPAIGLVLLCMIGLLLVLIGVARQRQTSPPQPADTSHAQNWQQVGPQEAAEMAVYIVGKERPDLAGVTPQVSQKDVQGHTVYDVTFIPPAAPGGEKFKQVVVVSIDTTQGKIFISESN
jgi:hypothetical protein